MFNIMYIYIYIYIYMYIYILYIQEIFVIRYIRLDNKIKKINISF